MESGARRPTVQWSRPRRRKIRNDDRQKFKLRWKQDSIPIPALLVSRTDSGHPGLVGIVLKQKLQQSFMSTLRTRGFWCLSICQTNPAVTISQSWSILKLGSANPANWWALMACTFCGYVPPLNIAKRQVFEGSMRRSDLVQRLDACLHMVSLCATCILDCVGLFWIALI